MYHAPDTWRDVTPSHIILTLGWPVLALPLSLTAKRGAASTIFNDFGMSRPGIKPVTARSPEWILYQLSYRGRWPTWCQKNDVTGENILLGILDIGETDMVGSW